MHFAAPVPMLSRYIQHIFDENTISHSWIIDQHMRNCANKLSVLNDRTAAHPLCNTRRILLTVSKMELLQILQQLHFHCF